MKAEKKRIKRRGRLNKTKKMPKNPKPQKQLTLDSIPNASQKEPAKPNLQSLEKRIVITEIGVSTKEDELALKVSFKLFPSKTAFSKVQSDLLFDNQKINSVSIRIPQGALAADEFELTPVLDMKGIPTGRARHKSGDVRVVVFGRKVLPCRQGSNCGLCAANPRIQIR